MKRDYYLNSVKEEYAIEIIDQLSSKISLASETVSVYDSLNRVVSKSVYANVSSPSYNASAMDGYMTKHTLTKEASVSNKVLIKHKDYKIVNTGNIIDDEYDTVIMVEDAVVTDEGIEIIQSHTIYQNIRPIGEDIVKGELVIAKNTIITPVIISALLSSGNTNIFVYKKPNILIIPTGDEIVNSKDNLNDGEVIDSNSYFMKNEITNLGGIATILPPVKDEYNLLKETIKSNIDHYDLVLIGAGSSAGTKDYTYQIMKEIGKLHIHGINIKPGKPTIIGEINKKPVIGIPGYPVSTFISFNVLVKRLINNLLHQEHSKPNIIQAKLTKKVYSSLKNKEYIRVSLGYINNQISATPLKRGAAIQMSLVKSDGLLVVNQLSEGHNAQEIVDIHLPNELKDYSKTFTSIGSHDIILDVINDYMNDQSYKLNSSHVGSFGGVLAIKNKEAHIAPIHILHTDGTYNKHIIKEYLDSEYLLIEGVKRTQGLYVKKGNPKKIKSLKDIIGKSFVNRQKGSGTRILFDQLLSKENIQPNSIKGYYYELATHTQVAVQVLNDRYDVGLGIKSVSKRYDLDFIELAQESYDFLVHKDTLQEASYLTFIKILKSQKFKNHLKELEGYILDNPGEIIQ